MVASFHSYQYEVFRELLIKARKEAEFTQTQLAQQLNVPQSFVSKYEQGERRLDFTEFVEIAELLKVDINSFVNAYRKMTK